jgi:hypothetical protein
LSLAFGFIAALAVSAVAEPSRIDPAAQAVVERTRTTTATYSVYHWDWIRLSNGEPYRQWSAEFHHGTRHRVESPLFRGVADCAAGTGTLLFLATGETRTGAAVARSACGIDSNEDVTSIELAGETGSAFGPAETVRLFAGGKERIYVVDRDGVLLAAEIFATAEGNSECLQSAPTALERSVPEGDIFSEDSLAYSVVAPRFQRPPAGNFGDYWIGDRRCIEEP